MKGFIVVLSLSLSLASTAVAQEGIKLPTVPDTDLQRFSSQFVKVIDLLGQGKLDEGVSAIESLRSEPFEKADGNPFGVDQRQVTVNTLKVFGTTPLNFSEVELVGFKHISSRSALLFYIAHGDKVPVLFHLQTYKESDGKWHLHGLDFRTGVKVVAANLNGLEYLKTPVRYTLPNSSSARTTPAKPASFSKP